MARRPSYRWLFPLLAMSYLPLHAMDLPGAGETPGILPTTWWFGWYNDYLGNARPVSSDDFRTNRFVVGWHPNAWTFSADWSNLTTENPSERYPRFGLPDPFIDMEAEAGRCDELTLSATRTWWSSETAQIAAGPGMRWAGNLGGESLQQRVHQDTSSHKVDAPYEDDVTPLAGLAIVRGTWHWPAHGSWAVVVDGAGLASTIGELQAEASTRLAWHGPGGASWIGWRQAFRAGNTASDVAATVAAHERGGWLVAGLEAPAAVFTFAANDRTDAVEGSLQFRAPTQRTAPGGALLPAEAELGIAARGALTDTGNGYDLRLAWGCPALAGWWHEVLRGTLTGRRIERSLTSTWDLAGRTQQVIGGVQLAAWPTPRTGFGAVPYVSAGVGWHHAVIEAIGTAHYTDGGRLDTLVGEGEAGLRVGWTTATWASGAALAWNRQVFAREADVAWTSLDDHGDLTLAQPGTSIILRWWVGLTW